MGIFPCLRWYIYKKYKYIYIYIYCTLGIQEKRRGGFTSHGGMLLSPISWYHNRDVWTFVKLMKMIEIMKMMQIPYLDIWSMLLSWQVLHRSNSSYMYWNDLFQKKIKGNWGHNFLEKNRGIFLVFFLLSWKF